MGSHNDDICDDGEDGDDPRSRWNRCIFGSVFSISAGIILGTVGTVVMASEMPVLVGTGVGVSMAAAYCGKTYRGGRKDDDDDDYDDDDDDDYCKCFNKGDNEDTCAAAEQEEEKEEEEDENPPEDEPCSTNQDINGYRCTCSCMPNSEENDNDQATC